MATRIRPRPVRRSVIRRRGERPGGSRDAVPSAEGRAEDFVALPRDLFERLLKLARVAEPGLDIAPLPLRQREWRDETEGWAIANSIGLARSLHRLRRRRALYFDSELFSEPAWDLLLGLYVATLENRPVGVTRACKGAEVPTTTALRWLAVLEARGLVERESDRMDARRAQVRLSPEAVRIMTRLLTDIDVILTAKPEGG